MYSSKRSRAVMLAAGAAAGVAAWKAWRTAGAKRRNAIAGRGKSIVVLGAGFGGMTVAQELCKQTAADGPDIWLVDRNNFLLFTPMLTEVAGGEIDARHIVAAPRRLSPRIRFVQGDVKEIDLDRKTVVVQTGVDGERTREWNADHLVIALGAVANFHDIPGLREHSLGMKSIQDGAALHAHVLRCVEAASVEPDAAVRREYLTFVVGGGGYTGVETMAAINDLARDEVARRPELAGAGVTAMIAEPTDRLLPELSADLAAFAQKRLEANGVRVLLNVGVTRASASRVELADGQSIPTRTLVWSGGVTPNPLVAKINCKRGHHGGILVDRYCAVMDRPGVWALGDCAEVPGKAGHAPYAPTAQNATREGELVARNILASLRGAPPQPFTFRPIGQVALVGRHSGVAKLYGYNFSGLLAWAMWRAIYLAKMPGAAQRTRIALDWILDFVFGRNPSEVPLQGATTARAPAVPAPGR